MTSPIEKPTYLLRTLGLVGLEARGERVTGPASQRRRLALLALVGASIGQRLSREKVLAYLWPETDAERGRNALSQLLHGIKRELGDGLIATPDEISLNERVISVDVADFRSAVARQDWERAVSLYAGPFLDGFFIKDAPEFEQWADETRRNLQQECVVALERVAAAARSRGDHQAALRAWRQLSRVEPYSGRAVLGAMESLAALGDPAAALEEARIHGLLLKNELEAAPDADVERFADRLRRGELAAAVTNTTLKPGPVDSNAPPVGEPALESGMPPALGGSSGLRSRHRTLALAAIGIVLSGAAAIAALERVRSNALSTGAPSPVLIMVDRVTTPAGDPGLAAIGVSVQRQLESGLREVAGVVVAPPQTLFERAATGNPQGSYRVTSEVLSVPGARDSVEFRTAIEEAQVGGVHVDLQPLRAARRDAAARFRIVETRIAGTATALAEPGVFAPLTMSLPPSPEAYRQFLAGYRAFDSEHYSEALRLFRAAMGRDTSYLTPQLYVVRTFYRWGFCDSAVAAARAAERLPISGTERGYMDIQVARCEVDFTGEYAAAVRMMRISPKSQLAISAGVLAAIRRGNIRLADSLIRHGPLLPARDVFTSHHWTYHAASEFQYDAQLVDSVARTGSPQNQVWLYLYRAEDLAAMGRFADVDSSLPAIDALANDPYLDAGVARRRIAAEYETHGHVEAARSLRVEAAAWYRLHTPLGPPDSTQSWRLGLSLLEVDSTRGARAVLLPLLQLTRASPELAENVRGALGVAAALEAQNHAAFDELAWLAARPTRFDFGNAVMWRARIQLALGDTNAALALVRESLADGYPEWPLELWGEPAHQIPGIGALLNRDQESNVQRDSARGRPAPARK